MHHADERLTRRQAADHCLAERALTPGDLAATIFHHMGVPVDVTYEDHQRRPRYVVENGEPIRELV